MYLRGAKDGDIVDVAVDCWPEASLVPGSGGPGLGMKVFRLTTEWKRYWVSGMVPQGAEGVGLTIGPCVNYLENGSYKPAPNKDPIMWIDGLQAESGTEPTAFTTE